MTTVKDADEKLQRDDSSNNCHKFLFHGDLSGAWLNACGNYFCLRLYTVTGLGTQKSKVRYRNLEKQERIQNETLQWRIQ